MADPTNVYEVTFEAAKVEKEALDTLSSFDVVLAKRVGAAQRQKKWSVAIRHKGTKQATRDKLKSVKGVQRVRIP